MFLGAPNPMIAYWKVTSGVRSQVTYVRFGLPPAGERSELAGPLYEYAHQRRRYSWHMPAVPMPIPDREIGVSVFRASLRKDGAIVIDTRGGRDWQLRGQFALFLFADPSRSREAYLVSGDEVGTGGDGEPLLRNCRVLGRIPLTTAIVADYWSEGPDTRMLGLEPAEVAELEAAFNRWRYLDGTREGHRTPRMGENCIEAFAPPGAREVLHRHNERKWRRRRPRGGDPRA